MGTELTPIKVTPLHFSPHQEEVRVFTKKKKKITPQKEHQLLLNPSTSLT